MKKILLWVLTFSLSLAFVACGTEEKTSQSTPQVDSSEITDTSEKEDSLSNDEESSMKSGKQEDSSIDSSEETSEDEDLEKSSKQDDSSIEDSGETSGEAGDAESSSENEEWADIEFPRP